jgi:hypothetical protein
LVVPPFVGQDGIERPTRHANEFWDSYGIPLHDEARRPGDLIFFSREGDRPTHIGILRDEETYIHAPGKDETVVESKPIAFEAIAMNSLRFQFYRRNPIGFKSPVTSLARPTRRRHQRPV